MIEVCVCLAVCSQKSLKCFFYIVMPVRCRPWRWASLGGILTRCCDSGDFRASTRRAPKPSTMTCSVWSLPSLLCLMFALAALQCTEGKIFHHCITHTLFWLKLSEWKSHYLYIRGWYFSQRLIFQSGCRTFRMYKIKMSGDFVKVYKSQCLWIEVHNHWANVAFYSEWN